ncbi:hypothetical protein F1188_13535 [Roseospira marina]|uniref:Uncharacterized protein n=1 Tax=Roseospira marina TaxID=140057 RepID=A0A5M6I995_9PROT|nr:hypothetical protein [Roseospira marina]KAA5604844.1 hypothetical protein F1188_13535 [Roseospira marina]MBB4315176.1 hypothetical protein [Roseospira marina]MBB5088176.1 hypothetical protein [Roseospira marina]
MKRFTQITFHFISLAAVIVLFSLPGNEYAWMLDMAPDLPAVPEDPGAGDRVVAGTALVGLVILCQAIAIRLSKRWVSRMFSVGLIAVAVVGWAGASWV